MAPSPAVPAPSPAPTPSPALAPARLSQAAPRKDHGTSSSSANSNKEMAQESNPTTVASLSNKQQRRHRKWKCPRYVYPTVVLSLLTLLLIRQLFPSVFSEENVSNFLQPILVSPQDLEKNMISALLTFPPNPFDRTTARSAKDFPFVLDRSKEEPLNILVLFPDDWRYNAIGDEQPGVVYTPFLTQLAKQGIRFKNNFATTSICWMSRATLFSGRYASRHMSHRLYCPLFMKEHNWNGSWPYLLQKFGNYFVGHVGKWQYHANARVLYNWSTWHEGKHWWTIGGKQVHAADLAADDAIRFLRERPKTNKFALTVAYYPPKPVGNSGELGAQWQPDPRHVVPYQNHTFIPPYNFSEAFELLPSFLKRGISQNRFWTRFRTNEMYQASLRNYMALVSHVDEASSRIIEELRKQGVLNKTMIIVSADNGMMLGSHGLAGKWHPFEDSIRVPLVIYDPRLPENRAGIVEERMTLNIDLAATIVAAAKVPKDPRIQGEDVSELYLGGPRTTGGPETKTTTDDEDKNSYNNSTTTVDPHGGKWREDFFYEFPLTEFPESTALRTHRYKYLFWPLSGKLEQLFDLHEDPYELNDLLPLIKRENRSDLLDLLNQLRNRFSVLREYYADPNGPKEKCQRGR